MTSLSHKPPEALVRKRDTAIIESGDTCWIEAFDQEITTLNVKDGGLLAICALRMLTLHGDSTVDGTIEFGCKFGQFCGQAGPATLRIDDSLTIDGDDGLITTRCIDAVIDGAAFKVLTLEGTGPQLCTQPPTDCTGSIVIDPRRPFQIDIQVALNNHGQVGCSGDADCEVKLTNDPKSGCGVWFVEDGGTLTVDVQVRADGNWFISDEDTLVVINSEPAGLTGNVTMKSGTLKVNEDFCTTGSLSMSDFIKRAATIEVAPNKTAKFAGACP